MTRWARTGEPYSDPRWLAWCDGLEERIEALRAEPGPTRCPTCDCSAHPPAETRRCWRCDQVKALSAFPRAARLPMGRHYDCRPCRNQESVARRQRNKVRMFKQAVRGVAS